MRNIRSRIRIVLLMTIIATLVLGADGSSSGCTPSIEDEWPPTCDFTVENQTMSYHQLYGTWHATWKHERTFVFSPGDRFQFKVPNMQTRAGAYTINQSQVDLRFDDGESTHLSIRVKDNCDQVLTFDAQLDPAGQAYDYVNLSNGY